MFQRRVARRCRCRSRDCYDPKSARNLVLMQPHNLAQPAPHAISDYRIADPFRCDETGSKAVLLSRKRSDHQERSAICSALKFDPRKFARIR
jgi:hypothetical protein